MAAVKLNRAQVIALSLAAIGAVVLPPAIIALAQGSAGKGRQELVPGPLSIPPRVAADHLFDRPLFAPERVEGDMADAPELVGVIGRLGKDAVALVRGSDGQTVTLKPGDGVGGWTLVTLSPDAALFKHGRRQIRVAVPGVDAPDDSGDTPDTSDSGDGDAPPDADQ